MSAQFINLSGSGMPSFGIDRSTQEKSLHNVDIIKSLQCDDSNCTGTVMVTSTAYQSGSNDNIKCFTPTAFRVNKHENSQTYQNLRQLYNQSSHIDNKQPSPMTNPQIAACTLAGLGAGIALATYFNK